MQYIKIDPKTVIGYDLATRTCKMFNPTELLAEKTAAETRLAQIPPKPDDKTLLEWAKTNYPTLNYETEKQTLQSKIAEATAVLAVK